MSSRVISPEEYDEFRNYLAEVTGIILGENKHYLISSRLNRLMEDHQLSTYTDLMKRLTQSRSSDLREKIIDAMTTNETMWFRDNYPFDILKQTLLLEYKTLRDRPLRIWSAACSSGQEPYSLSMVVQEFLMSNPGTYPKGIEIVGTDISASMLRFATNAIYDEAALGRGLSAERKQRFFTKHPLGWEVRPEIRSRVTFKSLNLQQSYSGMGKFDIIFCRNVLIYFSSEFKSDILNRMGGVIQPNGYILLGSSETPTRYTAVYKMIRTPQGVIYQYRP